MKKHVKYALVDLEELKETRERNKPHMRGLYSDGLNDGLKLFAQHSILSEKETLAKLKEIFIMGVTAGYNTGFDVQNPKFSKQIENTWKKIKNDLCL